MITEIWFRTGEDGFRLPVMPSDFERATSASYSDSTVLGLGDVATFTAKGLAKISFSSFFPNHDYPFNAYSDVPKPYDLVAQIKKWEMEGAVVRVTITGTDINQSMRITDFNYGERDGTGDVYYSVDFIEYRHIIVPKIEEATNNNNSNSNSNNRPTPPPTTTQKTHKVVKGDSLWSIAQKYYGKGSRHPEIKKANQDKYPKLKTSNVIYVNWELVIP